MISWKYSPNCCFSLLGIFLKLPIPLSSNRTTVHVRHECIKQVIFNTDLETTNTQKEQNNQTFVKPRNDTSTSHLITIILWATGQCQWGLCYICWAMLSFQFCNGKTLALNLWKGYSLIWEAGLFRVSRPVHTLNLGCLDSWVSNKCSSPWASRCAPGDPGLFGWQPLLLKKVWWVL